ncbi:MAG: methyltransferase domain-containing protein [Clostridiales bacterium]|nr:methyltransferase domain-containing protein [Clostridiales bacterium]
MSTDWSIKVQGIETLNLSRTLRFTEDFIESWIKKVGLKKKDSVLEIGCGPGTFTRVLSRKHKGRIVGLDLDTNFINYCNQERTHHNLEYIQGNALEVPFKDNSFDIVSSHTVIEHVQNELFLKEHLRLLKPGGTAVVMNVRNEGRIEYDPDVSTDREKELMTVIGNCFDKICEEVSICEHQNSPEEILKLMTKLGFKSIRLEVLPYLICSDNMDFRTQIIEYKKKSQLEFVEMALLHDSSLLTIEEINELKGLIQNKYSIKNTWSFSYVPLMIFIGKKGESYDQ